MRRGGSPRRRDRSTTEISSPVTSRQTSITSRTLERDIESILGRLGPSGALDHEITHDSTLAPPRANIPLGEYLPFLGRMRDTTRLPLFAIPVDAVKFFLKHRDSYAYDNDNPSNPYRYLEPPKKVMHTDNSDKVVKR